MTNVHETSSTVQFDTALRTLAAQATTRYAGEKARIDRGLVLALNGHVTIHQDGSASVQSGTDKEVVYTVNGQCDCPDVARALGGRCKHRWAKCLLKRAMQATQYYTSTTPAQGLVLGGHKATADAKRAQEEADGGLVAIICGYAKTVGTVAEDLDILNAPASPQVLPRDDDNQHVNHSAVNDGACRWLTASRG